MKLIYIHGIHQDGKNPLALEREWTEHLRKGCSAIGGQFNSTDFEIIMPYYGDILASLSKGNSRGSGALDNTSIDLEEFTNETFPLMEAHILRAEELYKEIPSTKNTRGKGPHKKVVKKIVRTLEYASPLKGRLALKFLKQAHAYISIPAIRSTIDNVVRPHLTGKTIIIAHSLGTVVAYNLLSELARTDSTDIEVPLFVTMGSPLSLRVIQKHIGSEPTPLKMVKNWINVTDEEDFIALGNVLLGDYFGMPIDNYSDVDNGYDDPHSLTGYISSRTVCEKFLQALKA